jgi:hypothetical protein
MSQCEWPPWELYRAYESASEEVESALASWHVAPFGLRRDAFVAYRAAADREDAAAFAWLRACEAHDAERPQAA